MGKDRMLFATDYPYESLSQSINFIKDCHLSKMSWKNFAMVMLKILGLSLHNP
jgi:predicted TIM-barrel fold metal-dependent hydrolase